MKATGVRRQAARESRQVLAERQSSVSVEYIDAIAAPQIHSVARRVC